ncbi:ATP-dependent helicase HrpB [Fulvimonas sp. R45]|uniref:ATP-dependent helicase HrpB n=1 Tax=Fulvimonas sp. R45 TaxID=3045937 RepID=UPI00265DB8C5|nr:ATP-dependent helicase HrpB [Fulvimonas sp. R45]MDO1528952.1 ATP-dependent helicase HrpB [Fulvimonas sp. R45]
MPAFPITSLLPEIRAALDARPRLVLEAPPGAGKTTQVPLALLDAPWLGGRRIVMLEPRRIAARAAAQFMARQLGEEVGRTVGYRIRFESKTGAATRIEVVTEGILTRLIQDDPELAGIGAILFDEFHERHLAGDLGAALALDVQATLRPDLRLLVMSATLDGERIAQWLDAPRITSPGRSHPVRIEHPPARAQESLEHHLARVARQALAENDGDVLAFLPGRREIARAQAVLEQLLPSPFGRGAGGEGTGGAGHRASPVPSSAPAGVSRIESGAGSSPEGRGEGLLIDIVPLHGELSLAEQQHALSPADPGPFDTLRTGTRRIVLATNVAESSVTLPGIRTVIDSGLAREPRFDPNTGFTRLETVAISQASADQRAGRAGRVAEGTAYRLWPQSRRLEPARMPEIAQAELSALALELAAWGSAGLPWLDPPPAGALAQARELLAALGALEADGRITPLGRRMLELGAAPRLAAAALRAPGGLRPLAADLLALMEARSPLRGEAARSDDFRVRVAALHAWRDRRGGAREADAGALAAIEQAAKGWRRRLGARSAASGTPDSHAVGDLLAHAFPDRIARRDDANPLRYTLANGRGARLHEQTALLGEPWLVVLDLRHEARDSLVLAAAPLDPRLLERDFPQRFTRGRALRWNEARDAVEAFEERRFGAIVLERRSVPVQPEDALPALLAAIRDKGLDALPWSGHARRLRLRMQALRAWMPEAGLPDVSDEHLLATLEDWLAPCLHGKRRLDALGEDALSQALSSLLGHEQRRLLDAQAPDSLVVPSGQARRLDYAPDAPPVLAVKLQELFGLADTPRVGGGRVPVTLHLLSPAGRPIQVTQDLKGFWERTYPEVKKELKGRYPRHPWPDDPWDATPTHRAKPRGT